MSSITRYCTICGSSIDLKENYCRNCGNKPNLSTQTSPKSATLAVFLCFFLGTLGIHRFYVGKIFTGILMLFTVGGFGIWTLIDLVYIVTGHFKDDKGQYLEFRRTKQSPFVWLFFGLLLLFALSIFYFGLIFSVVFIYTKGMSDVAEHQLAALRNGNLEKAYSYSSSNFKDDTSFQNFKKFVNDVSLQNNQGIKITKRSFKNNSGQIDGTINTKEGKTFRVQYHFIKEDGDWKIYNINIKPDLSPKENGLKTKIE